MPPNTRSGPRNAFAEDFLTRLDQRPEPNGAHEAATAGPWTVAAVPYLGSTGFALLREGETLEAGDEPYAIFRRRPVALLAAAVLPATGRDPLFRLLIDPDETGFPLRTLPDRTARPGRPPHSPAAPPTDPRSHASEETGEAPHPRQAGRTDAAAGGQADADTAGHLRDFDEDFVAALHVAAMLARSPSALASLLEAAGHVCLERVGRILDQRLR